MPYSSLSRRSTVFLGSQYSASSCGLEQSFIHSLIHSPDIESRCQALGRVLGRQWGTKQTENPIAKSSQCLVRWVSKSL